MITLRAPLACPQCGGKVAGFWTEVTIDGAEQRCGCGHLFTAEWPGFPFKPPTIIMQAVDAIAPGGNAQADERAAVREDAGEAGFTRNPDINGKEVLK
jgi:hypothetical protein